MTSATQNGASRAELGPAQVYCWVIGATLVVAGILGFFVDSGFDTGSNVQGDELILFEVNGIHNIVHLASGLVLLALAPAARGARAGALGFGLVYAAVTLWGFIDGNDVAGLIPVNTADNFLHLLLAGAGIGAGIAPAPADRAGPPGEGASVSTIDRTGRFDRDRSTEREHSRS